MRGLDRATSFGVQSFSADSPSRLLKRRTGFSPTSSIAPYAPKPDLLRSIGSSGTLPVAANRPHPRRLRASGSALFGGSGGTRRARGRFAFACSGSGRIPPDGAAKLSRVMRFFELPSPCELPAWRLASIPKNLRSLSPLSCPTSPEIRSTGEVRRFNGMRSEGRCGASGTTGSTTAASTTARAAVSSTSPSG